MQEQELFQSYEIKNWDYSPRLYKIIGVSAAINILALIIVGQTNLLTRKGCDSPFVGKVCSVLDTLYVGGKILTTDSEYKSEKYEPTELSDSDEIIFVNVADKLYYPEGYFALSNPGLVNPDGTMPTGGGVQDFPGIPNPTGTTPGGGGLLNTKPQYPEDKQGLITGDIPTTPLGTINGNPTRNGKTRVYKPRPSKTQNTESPNKLPDLTKVQTANKDENKEQKESNNNQTAVKSAPVKDVEINKQPLQDLVTDILANKQFDMNKQFAVAMDGTLTKEGKFDKKKSTFLTEKESGDEAMRNVAKTAIEKFGDSGWLGYLRNQGVEKINFVVVQDNEQLKIIVISDQPTPERANTISTGFRNLIQGALLLDKNGVKKLGDDERTLLSSTQINSSGKQFVLNFMIPKATAQEMINRKLEEARKKKEEEEKKNSSNGTAQVTENNQQTVK